MQQLDPIKEVDWVGNSDVLEGGDPIWSHADETARTNARPRTNWGLIVGLALIVLVWAGIVGVALALV